MESPEADFSLYVEDGGFEGSLAVSSIVKQVRIRASDACLRLVMRRIGAKTGWVRRLAASMHLTERNVDK